MSQTRTFQKAVLIINALAALILFIISPYNYSDGFQTLAAIQITYGAVFSLNLLFFLYKKNVFFAIILDTLLFSSLFFIIVISRSSVQSLSWFLILPVFVSLLLGLKFSIPLNFILSILYYYLLRYINENSADFINIPVSMLNFYALAGVSLLHEFVRYGEAKDYKDSARKDSLTGAYNRKTFEEILKVEIDRVKRSNIKCSFLYFSLENLDEINSNYGFNVGDMVIKEATAVFIKNLRPSDRIFRLSGEEFAVLFADADIEPARQATERIQNILKEQEIAGIKGIIFSAGMSSCREDDSINSILMRLLKSLKTAQARGQGHIVIKEL